MAAEFDTESLNVAFSAEKQAAVVGHLIYDDVFFRRAIGRIEASWFANENERLLVKVCKTYYRMHQRKPSEREVLENELIRTEPGDRKLSIKESLGLCNVHRGAYFPDALFEELRAWMQVRVLQLALPQAALMYSNHNTEQCVQMLNQAVRDYYAVGWMDDKQVKWDSFKEVLLRSEEDHRAALTTGNRYLDHIMAPNGQMGDGGLYRGDMTVFLAPSNVGKTSILATIVGHNIKRQKHVLYLTHEGRPEDIQEKIARSVLNRDHAELMAMAKDPAFWEQFEVLTRWTQDYLTYIPMNSPGLTIEKVAMDIDRYMEEFRGRNNAFYDLIVMDYPAKLTTEKAQHGHLQRRHIDSEIYNYCTQIALKYNCHMLTAIQSNRDGSKLNMGLGGYKNDNRLLTMENVSESWEPMTTAANVITLNRDEDDEREERLTMYLAKTRSGQKGIAFVTETNFKNCVTHHPTLPCFWYRSNEHLGFAINSFLQSHNGREVSSEQIRGRLALADVLNG